MAFVPVPCPGCGSTGGGGDVDLATVSLQALCLVNDSNGSLVQDVVAEWVYDSDGARTAIRYVDAITGDAVPFPADTHLEICRDVVTADTVVSTGIRRVSGVAPLDLKALRPGLQSATLTVFAGEVSAVTSDGTGVVPTGASVTWSVADTDDSSLAALTLTGDVAADYLVAFTYKAAAAG